MVGLQELKFDPENNTPEELAQKYKDDGNFEFKHSNYRLAIINYTEALKIKCDDNVLNATIYNNRSASHFYIKNYRSSLNDCISALILKPDYLKAKKRAIDCAFFLKDYEQCIKFCDDYLVSNDDDSIRKMRIKAVESKTKLERDKRKQLLLEKKLEFDTENTIKILNDRKIKFYDKKLYCGDLKHIPQPNYTPSLKDAVSFKNDVIHWPILFCYPEYLIFDCFQNVSELTFLNDCLGQVFEEKPSWDINNKYKLEDLNIYFENRFLGQVFLLNKNLNIKQVTVMQNFIVYDGVLNFYVLPGNTPVEREFLDQKRVKMS